jgi:hypothetical protein
MKYWRCRLPGVFEIFWPLFGHLIRFDHDHVYCERCPWREPYPVFFG